MPELVERRPDETLPESATVLGLPIHLMDDYLGWLIQQLQHQQGVHVVTLNAEMAMQGERNSVLAAIIQQAELVIPDGAGVVFYLGLRGKRVQRCPGIELAAALLAQSATANPNAELPTSPSPYSVFFYGGAPGVCEAAAQAWQARVPGIAIVGTQNGYLPTEAQPQFQQTLKTLQPNIILVGIGVPRQELWIAENRHLCPHAVWIGVGGSFDIWAGTKTRAPSWLRDNNLEWVYRLYQEPWRWRRMLVLPQFAWKAVVTRVLN